ncbi:tripartite tricarboxylate transporter substrate-binding protein [Verminephrobacter eiseniae]|uniref:tripartite tricarboxylate transporter substrate-binding protein n=1 Tax=Verminephrobacter eiseniae TaxID=364317 RepID=UPI0038B3970D
MARRRHRPPSPRPHGPASPHEPSPTHAKARSARDHGGRTAAFRPAPRSFCPSWKPPGRASCEPAFRWPAASGWRPQQQQREPKPGTLACASSGNGSAQHLASAFFEPLAEVEPIHVPCRGGGPALNDVMGWQALLFLANVASSLGHIRSGCLRPLAVTAGLRCRWHALHARRTGIPSPSATV